MAQANESLVAGPNDDGRRLDRVLRRRLPGLSLSGVYRLLRRGEVKVNGGAASPALRLKPGDRIDITVDTTPFIRPPVANTAKTAVRQKAQRRLAGLTLFCNEHVLALNKPYGVLVHGRGSLEELVAAAYAGGGHPSLSFRPGPAHRLDRNTTGVQLWSLSLSGARELTRLFRERQVKKVYCALVAGGITQPDVWYDRVERDSGRRITVAARAGDNSGRAAVTRVLPVLEAESVSLVFFLPDSGRTHQLRFQAGRRGHPLPGDVKYGGAPDQPRYLLHCLGTALPPGTFGAPPLIAPFDSFGRTKITSLFGRGALDVVYRRCRELLDWEARPAVH